MKQLIFLPFMFASLRTPGSFNEQVKYTVKKLEQIIYELTLAATSSVVPKSGAAEPGEPVEGGEDLPAAQGDDGSANADAGAGKRPRRN